MNFTVCVICKGRVEKGYPVGHFDDFKCSDCGFYSVNRTLLGEMATSKQQFNVERARHYIAIRSKLGSVVAIDRLEATVHQLIA